MNSRGMEVNQYVTFKLGGETFALGIDMVREVLEMAAITKVPRMPEAMRGVINLRGQAVPVFNLRAKFGMEPVETTVDTCIIITEHEVEGEAHLMGAMADAVSEVLEIEAMEAPPAMGAGIDTRFLEGMARQGGGFVMVLDPKQVFSNTELTTGYAGMEQEEPLVANA